LRMPSWLETGAFTAGPKTRCQVWLPGTDQPQSVGLSFSDGELAVTVPLQRGYAMLQVGEVPQRPGK
jgi:hypothetical protein